MKIAKLYKNVTGQGWANCDPLGAFSKTYSSDSSMALILRDKDVSLLLAQRQYLPDEGFMACCRAGLSAHTLFHIPSASIIQYAKVMYFGVACSILHQKESAFFFSLKNELISFILATINNMSSVDCVFFCMCASVYLKFYLSAAFVIIYFIQNHCRDNKDSRDKALRLKY